MEEMEVVHHANGPGGGLRGGLVELTADGLTCRSQQQQCSLEVQRLSHPTCSLWS
jgi:hypothetical protein